MTVRGQISSAAARTCLAMLLSLFALPSPAHWPDQPAHRIADLGEFRFEGGGAIANLRMSFVTHGTLSAARDNVVVILHGFSLNHHNLDHLIGPGRPIDTRRYFVVSPDSLGNTQTTFEHSSSPTASGLKMAFPAYNARDQVEALHRLLVRELGLTRVHAIIGVSWGGYLAMQYAVSHPAFMDGVVPIVGGALRATHGFFRGPLMLSVLETCNGWRGGEYETNPIQCATNAISTLVPFQYSVEWWLQYIDTPEAYTRWRHSAGEFSLDIQDARDLHYAIRAVGRSQIGHTPGFAGDAEAALRSVRAEVLFVANPQDPMNAFRQVQAQVELVPKARLVSIDSVAAHMICCSADPQATHELGVAIRTFLSSLSQPREEGSR